MCYSRPEQVKQPRKPQPFGSGMVNLFATRCQLGIKSC